MQKSSNRASQEPNTCENLRLAKTVLIYFTQYLILINFQLKFAKICEKLLVSLVSAKFEDILKIGAKACKIPQIQLHSCVDFQKC